MTKLFLSVFAAATLTADETELETLKRQLSQIQQTISAMQAKIDSLENTPAISPLPKQDAAVADPTDHHDHDHDHEAAAPLDLALFINGSYVVRSQKDEQLQHVELPGIAHSPYGDDGHGHGTYNAKNGFNLNYVELLLSSEISPNLDLKTLLHFSEGGVEVEEAFFTAKDLPYGLSVKGGKFLSHFGYLNRQHHHEWDFSDLPLVYEAFLGTEGLNEIGAQLQWHAPVEPDIVFGIEALQGKNEAMFGQSALYAPGGSTLLASSAAQPSLLIAYAKTSADIGDTHIRAGASMAHGSTRLDHFTEDEAYALKGTSDLYGIDVAIRHHFGQERSLTWQSEWLSRVIEGTKFTAPGYTSLDKKQSGYYTQLVYAHDDHWRAGARYDNIYQNRVIEGGLSQNLPETMEQLSAMIEYNHDEIARYRLQYTHSNAYFDENLVRQDFDSFLFSINFTLGRHAHHPF